MNCCDDSETGNYSCFACGALVQLMSAGISLPLSFESLLSFLGFIFSMMTLRTTFYCFTANVFAGFGLLSHEQVLLVSLDAASKVSELAIGDWDSVVFPFTPFIAICFVLRIARANEIVLAKIVWCFLQRLFFLIAPVIGFPASRITTWS